MLSISITTSAQFDGDGTSGNPYKIKYATDLALLATYINAGTAPYSDAGKHYLLENDLDLSAYGSGWNGGEGWIPIGEYYSNEFKGFFDGNNKKITGLYIRGYREVGLFGSIGYNAAVKNLGLEGVDIDVELTLLVGGVAVSSGGNISNCWITGKISAGASSMVGGIIGTADHGNIENCYSSCQITVSGDGYYSYVSAGGIVGGCGDSFLLSNCYSTGSISASSSTTSVAGGIVGTIQEGIISNCYSTASVSSSAPTAYIGGVLGRFTSDMGIFNCAALNPKLTCTGSTKHFGRILPSNNDLVNNIAFDKMLNPDDNTTWENKGLTNTDGEDISKEAINTDGTLGNRFTAAGGWTTQNGKLPGLFGNTVEMPEHLRLEGIAEITTESLPNGIVNNPYIATLTATGATPIVWAIENGTLPAGLSININGVISGTPTTAGTAEFTVKATNSVGSDYKKLTITIEITPPVITTTTLPDGAIGVEYTVALTATGAAPIVWAIESGNLPNGLSINSAGVISGTPTTAGTFEFTIMAKNSAGEDRKMLTIKIDDGVGVDDLRFTIYDVQVYPNPTRGELIINNEQLIINNIEVFDIYGRKCHSLPVTCHSSLVTINISHLPNGIYFLRIDGQTVKVIKN